MYRPPATVEVPKKARSDVKKKSGDAESGDDSVKAGSKAEASVKAGAKAEISVKAGAAGAGAKAESSVKAGTAGAGTPARPGLPKPSASTKR